jgi:hypothetical protein
MTIAHQNKIRTIAGLCMTGILLLGGGAAANAQTLPVEATSMEDTTDLRTNLTAMGIAAETQDSLIAELEAGNVWDSMSGAPAVSTTTFEENGFTQERRVYADGSVGISEIEIPAAEPEPGTISTRAVTGCTAAGVAGETQFRGCLVKEQSGLVSAEFELDYLVGAGRALIMSTGDSRVTVFFGNYSNKSLSIPQAEALVGVPARAQLGFQFQAGAVNSDGYVYFRLTQAGVASSSSAI